MCVYVGVYYIKHISNTVNHPTTIICYLLLLDFTTSGSSQPIGRSSPFFQCFFVENQSPPTFSIRPPENALSPSNSLKAYFCCVCLLLSFSPQLVVVVVVLPALEETNDTFICPLPDRFDLDRCALLYIFFVRLKWRRQLPPPCPPRPTLASYCCSRVIGQHTQALHTQTYTCCCCCCCCCCAFV